jgi:hypothetical protein
VHPAPQIQDRLPDHIVQSTGQLGADGLWSFGRHLFHRHAQVLVLSIGWRRSNLKNAGKADNSAPEFTAPHQDFEEWISRP